MRLSRIGLGVLVASLGSTGSAMAFSGSDLSRIGADHGYFSRELSRKRTTKPKPNRLSQKKRRLNARRIGKQK